MVYSLFRYNFITISYQEHLVKYFTLSSLQPTPSSVSSSDALNNFVGQIYFGGLRPLDSVVLWHHVALHSSYSDMLKITRAAGNQNQVLLILMALSRSFFHNFVSKIQYQ